MALIFPQATPRQLKQLAKQLQTQAAAVLGAPLTLAQAQELAARAVGHESFHAAQQHRPADEGQSTLEAMARRYVPLWRDTEVPPYPKVNATPSWAIEGPSQLQGEMRFRDEDGIVYRYVAPEADADGSSPPPEYLLREARAMHVSSSINFAAFGFSSSPYQVILDPVGQLKEHIWAGQLGLKTDLHGGLHGTADELAIGLTFATHLMPAYLDRVPHESGQVFTLLDCFLPALCWLRDLQGSHVSLSRHTLMMWLDWDRLAELAEVEGLPKDQWERLNYALHDLSGLYNGLHALKRSLECVDLEGRDRKIQSGDWLPKMSHLPGRRNRRPGPFG